MNKRTASNYFISSWSGGKDSCLALYYAMQLGLKPYALKLAPSFLGQEISFNLISDLEKANVDPCGENGEYHTVVLDGPIFTKPLNIQKMDIFKHKNYCYLDFLIDSEQ